LLVKHTIRYEGVYSAATTLNILGEELLNCFGVGSSTTTVYFPVTAVRIKRVKAWLVSNASNTGGNTYFGTIRLQWQSARGSNSEIEDVQLGQTNVAYINDRPPYKSFSSMWYDISQSSQSTETVFSLSFSPGSVVCDVTLEVQLANLNAQAVTVSGAVGGRVYATALGGGTNGLVPVDYPTLASLPLRKSEKTQDDQIRGSNIEKTEEDRETEILTPTRCVRSGNLLPRVSAVSASAERRVTKDRSSFSV